MAGEMFEVKEMESSQSNSPIVAIMELANMISVPMSLNAVVRLNVADAIWQGGSNHPLTATEILSAAASGPSGDPENLQRILRMLTSYGVFNEHLSKDKSERRYSLTEVGKTLVTDENGLSYAPYVLQHHQNALMRAWPLVHEAVVDPSSEPFVKANGEPAYSYYGKKPEMNDLMQKAMSGVSVPFMKAFLNDYDGFQGMETLVDVGGSSGDCLRMIMNKNPSIKGVNFDLPEVVGKAPKILGVTHVGGDMLKSIPHGDAIFLKWVLTTWTDDECKQILKNCYNALPQGGKVIACEPVLPSHTDDSQRSRALHYKKTTIYQRILSVGKLKNPLVKSFTNGSTMVKLPLVNSSLVKFTNARLMAVGNIPTDYQRAILVVAKLPTDLPTDTLLGNI